MRQWQEQLKGEMRKSSQRASHLSKTAAVSLIVTSEGSLTYVDMMRKCRAYQIGLRDPRHSLASYGTGGLILEILDVVAAEKTDRLAERLRSVRLWVDMGLEGLETQRYACGALITPGKRLLLQLPERAVLRLEYK